MGLTFLLGFLLYLSFSPWSFLALYFHLILVTFLISVPLTGLSAESNVPWASFHVVFLPVMFLFFSIRFLSFAGSHVLVWLLSSFWGCIFAGTFCARLPSSRDSRCLSCYSFPPGDFCHPSTLAASRALTVAFGSPYVYFEPADYICLLVLLKIELFSFSLLLLYALQE